MRPPGSRVPRRQPGGVCGQDDPPLGEPDGGRGRSELAVAIEQEGGLVAGRDLPYADLPLAANPDRQPVFSEPPGVPVEPEQFRPGWDIPGPRHPVGPAAGEK